MSYFDQLKKMNRALRGGGSFDPDGMRQVLEETHDQEEEDGGLIVISRIRLPGIELIVPDPKIILV